MKSIKEVLNIDPSMWKPPVIDVNNPEIQKSLDELKIQQEKILELKKIDIKMLINTFIEI